MHEDAIFEKAQTIRQDLAALLQQAVSDSMTALKMPLDAEVEQEIRERIAVLIFDEMVNDMPMVPYLAVWEEGSNAIVHAYMSPKIEALAGYTPAELLQVGFINIVRGNIISFFRESSTVEEQVSGISEAQEKRAAGLLENRHWEGCYKIAKKDDDIVWVIDRSTITRFRNSASENVICLSNGILLESTELLERRESGRRPR